MRPAHDFAGYGAMLAGIRFAAWAESLRQFPTYEQVMARFSCSRPTAYRWLAIYAEARGIDRPYRKPGRRAAA